MKAVVKQARGHGFVDYVDVEEVPPSAGQVKVKVEASGLCGSDLHLYHDTINYPIRTPVVLGHEFSGTVVEKGTGVGGEVAIGDRVTGEPTMTKCGKCDYCRSEHYNMCPDRKVMGYWFDGSFAPFCNVAQVHHLPAGVSFEAGAMTELLACCVHAVLDQAGVCAGDTVAITGPGPVGLMAAMVAKAAGGTVILCGRSADHARLERALTVGVDVTIDSEKENALERIQDLTNGYGADVVVECAGTAGAIDAALDMVRRRGRYTQMGLPGEKVNVAFEKVAYKELQVTGGLGQRHPAWVRALSLMESGAVQLEKLISHELPLSEWHQGFDLMERQECIKILLRPNES
jgi:L-iditol 2-dehydrogenase